MHDSVSHGDIRFVWLFGAVALFILLLACVNFINLSTAKSANRAREVGLRKVIGSLRSSLIGQFLTESVFMSVLSFVVAVLLAWLLLPFFNQLAEKNLQIPWTSAWFLPVLLLAALLVGLLAGIYPAFYLSSFKPVKVLKGDISRGARSSVLRNILVVFQFTCSIALIIATIVVYTQTSFMLNRKVGFDKDQVLVIQGTNTLNGKLRSFRDELLKQSSIQSVSIGDYLPVSNTKRNGNTFWLEEKANRCRGTGTVLGDRSAYLQTLGIELLEGRNSTPVLDRFAGGHHQPVDGC
ncbi:MAG: FtsX-like permease family protein [Flavihumibacter sp.]